MAEQTAPRSPLFDALVAKFGISTALNLLPLLSGQSSTASKAFAGAGLAGNAASAAGGISPTLGTIGKAAGPALGLASGGYGAYKAATDPNLSKTQQVGHSGRAVADTLMGILIPYYGIAKAVSIVGQVLSRSGSPQVAGTGRALDQVAEPSGAKAFWNVAQGDLSPKAAFNRAGAQGLTYDFLGPIGAVLKGVGVNLPFLNHKPTTGTMFRKEAGSIFDRIPALKGTDTSKYTIDPNTYGALPQAVRDRATSFSQQLAPMARDSKSNPQAYQNQIVAMLLNRFGSSLPEGL